MWIKNIEIQNYKGFKNLSLDFHPNQNVFIGSNASGKTSLLKAIIKSVYSLTRGFTSNEENPAFLTLADTEIAYKEHSCHIILSLRDFPEYDQPVFAAALKTTEKIYSDERFGNARQNMELFTQFFRQRIASSPLTLPIFKLYTADRTSVDHSRYSQNTIYTISQLEAWSNIYHNALSYGKFFKWFFDNETDELRLQRDLLDFAVENPNLKFVRYALAQAFELLHYGEVRVKTTQVKKFNNSELVPTLVIENLITGKIDELENKSDGEKTIIALIGDIAYNLSLAKDFVADDDYLKSPGVVIIDEIENHLHPTWQREIIPILTKLFPNIQFFIATHSPQVISSVKSESVFVCQDFRIERLHLKTKGEDSNALLKYVFGSTERPREYLILIQKFQGLIEKHADFSEIEDVIQQIRNIENEDKSFDYERLIDELNLQMEAYKFDREHDSDN